MDDHHRDHREQDRYLPIANVSRIMKKTLPDNAKIAKDAKECVQECVSEFIGFITSEAADRCLQEKRKTINGEDILWAMENLGFENYSEVLKLYLQRFRDQSKPQPQGAIPANFDQVQRQWMEQQYLEQMKLMQQQQTLPPLQRPTPGAEGSIIPQLDPNYGQPHQMQQERLPKLQVQQEEDQIDSINL
eukprot:NODE_200_length_15202_cov_0.356618.p8 type:complete len:189 gc:universal NODE_200_length_15202_cov_0.356618:2418-1852(-)